jgi:hypothetical protein
MAGTTPHWATPHMVEDILAAARRPGVAEPTEIRIRAALYARLLQEPDALVLLDGIPLVVDDQLPAFPGFEIHRACAPARGAAA